MFEGPEAPDEPEEAGEGPGHAHVVEALGDGLALAPGRLAAVHRLGAVAVILQPGLRAVGGDGERVAQSGLGFGVRDTDPWEISFIMRYLGFRKATSTCLR